MKINEMRRRLSRELEPITDDSNHEAALMLEHVLKCDFSRLFLLGESELDIALEKELFDMLIRRRAREPLQYILGEWEFMHARIKCDSRALIPRSATEDLVCEIIRLSRGRRVKTILDMCTGSGCIGIALGMEYPNAAVDFADISAEALELARTNAILNSIEGTFIQSDLFNNIALSYDIIVINPPYLSANDMCSKQRELGFEPQNALYGGEDGLDFYRRIRAEAVAHLNEGALLAMEIGAAQGEYVKALFGGHILKDSDGLDRIVVCRRGDSLAV